MKNINKVAHLLAQKQYTEHRNFLAAECKAMLAKGKTRTEMDAYLQEVVTEGRVKSLQLLILLDRLPPIRTIFPLFEKNSNNQRTKEFSK